VFAAEGKKSPPKQLILPTKASPRGLGHDLAALLLPRWRQTVVVVIFEMDADHAMRVAESALFGSVSDEFVHDQRNRCEGVGLDRGIVTGISTRSAFAPR
jgi:hypothetical protein